MSRSSASPTTCVSQDIFLTGWCFSIAAGSTPRILSKTCSTGEPTRSSTNSSVAKVRMQIDAFPFFADLTSYWPQIVKGLRDTILLSVTITVTGLVGGIGIFGLALSPRKLVRLVTQSYISLFIGTPLIVFLFLLYYGLPNLGVRLSPFVIAVFGFTLNVSAYNARYLTIAYKGLEQAELESARAQGFSRFQVFRLITAPQSLRMSVPSLTNQAIQNVKDSSIVFLIQYIEFFAQMQEVASRTFLFFKTYLFTAFVYLLLVSVVVLVARRLERKLAIPGMG